MKEEKPKKVWDKSSQWPEELNQLKSILAETELIEEEKWGAPTYTLNKKNVLGIAGFKDFVTIWFWNGVFLKDDKNRLVNASPGQTRGLRQWRFKNLEEIKSYQKEIKAYVLEAIENEKKGLSIKPEKKTTVISDFFQTQLDKNSELKVAFGKLTPGRQREYLEHIDSAKREETKISRMEKITPNILNGIGLNDKYK